MAERRRGNLTGGLSPIWLGADFLPVALSFCLPITLAHGAGAVGWAAYAWAIAMLILSAIVHALSRSGMARRLGYTPFAIRLHAFGDEAISEVTHIQRKDSQKIITAGPFASLCFGLSWRIIRSIGITRRIKMLA